MGKNRSRAAPQRPLPASPHGTWSDPMWSDEMREKCYDYLENYDTIHGDVIPSMEGLAEHLNARMRYLNNWIKEEKHPELVEVAKKIKARQKRVICSSALGGTFNASFSKFLLAAAHGMKEDKQEEAPREPVNEIKINVVHSNADDSD